jgi:hypothetical protein
MARVKHKPRPGTRTRKFQFQNPRFSNSHLIFLFRLIYNFLCFNVVSANEAEEKKKRKFKPGTVALREIRKFQKSVNLLIPCAPFVRCVSFFHSIYFYCSNSYISNKSKLDLCF